MSENLKYGYDVNDLGLVRNLDAFYKLVSRELSETGDITFELDNSRDIYSTEEVFTKLVEGDSKHYDVKVPKLIINNPKDLPYSKNVIMDVLYDAGEFYVKPLGLDSFFLFGYYGWGYLPNYYLPSNYESKINTYFSRKITSMSTKNIDLYGSVTSFDVSLTNDIMYFTIKFNIKQMFFNLTEVSSERYQDYLYNFYHDFDASKSYRQINGQSADYVIKSFFDEHKSDFKYFHSNDFFYSFDFEFDY
jgi:hypothetical protein